MQDSWHFQQLLAYTLKHPFCRSLEGQKQKTMDPKTYIQF